MPGKVAPSVRCALCDEAAVCYCVNDDAHLCTGCDVKMHSANPLLARHERRPLSALACQAECASAAPSAAPAASHSTDCDVGVVPQLVPAAPVPAPVAAPAPVAEPAPMAPMAAPLDLYEDSFLGRSLTTSDLLDLDELELPGSGAFFDPLDDCVVPSFDAELRPTGGDRHMDGATSVQSSFLSQPPAFVPSYLRHAPYLKQQQQQQPVHMVPMGGAIGAPTAHVAAVPQAGPGPLSAADAEAEAARVQRHRERQRKKRAFGRAVRYQSRRAYAEIRPRIKGRFVTPEEYAAYQAQQAALAAGEPLPEMPAAAAEPAAAPEAPAAVPAAPAEPKVAGMMGGYMAPPVVPAEPIEEDAVVPMPAFLMA